ncbi:MAG: malto-oligosyltrehalose synthase, partial [Caulobacteraceae bacterium]|nr:malto-oligosyltrehalose synthase [Caulobacteraceae bacterium]
RFFNINDLAGLRMELEPVFAHAHKRVFAMLKDGEIDGLRIDHIDGLFDPKAYLKALRLHAGDAFYLVVEKILAPHERLRRDWPVQGATGYAYLNLSLGLMIEPSGETAFDDAWRQFGGANESFEEIARVSKLRILDFEMASELNALGRAAARLARSSPMTADLTRGLLQRAIKQTIANFPVYRTYVDREGAVDEADRRDIAWAISRARRFDPDLHPSAFDFLEQVLTADQEALKAKGLSRTSALRFAMKFQQLSGPVMAKGVEDTAFYRFNRFIALNEVGGAPERFGLAPALFHRANARRAEAFPFAMLASATHDTKRGEDARARLAALSELPDEWLKHATSWSRILRARIGDIEGKAAPARDDEYLLYQMLVGSWPIEMLEAPSPEALAAFGERLGGAMRKALREAKRRSNWDAPNAEYEAATLTFMNEALRPDGEAFLASFLPFVARIARYGVDNSLVQTVLKLTVPGVPDTYQGCELWDFSLVDPDNRRAVDYAAREAALAKVAPVLASTQARGAMFERLMESWQDGYVKLATISLLLGLRRERPALFAESGYRPINIEGEDAAFSLGFERAAGDESFAVVVALRPAMRGAKPEWEAFARLPEGRRFDLVRGCEIDVRGPIREWLGRLPFCVLVPASFIS